MALSFSLTRAGKVVVLPVDSGVIENLAHLREGRLKMSREGRRVAREMLRPATEIFHNGQI